MFGIFLNLVGQTFVWHKKLLGMPFSIHNVAVYFRRTISEVFTM